MDLYGGTNVEDNLSRCFNCFVNIDLGMMDLSQRARKGRWVHTSILVIKDNNAPYLSKCPSFASSRSSATLGKV